MDKLLKLLGMMTSAHDGEALNATRMFFKEASAKGLSLHDVGNLLQGLGSGTKPTFKTIDEATRWYHEETKRIFDAAEERQKAAYDPEEASRVSLVLPQGHAHGSPLSKGGGPN